MSGLQDRSITFHELQQKWHKGVFAQVPVPVIDASGSYHYLSQEYQYDKRGKLILDRKTRQPLLLNSSYQITDLSAAFNPPTSIRRNTVTMRDNHPWPFYENEGEVLFFDDFDDGILKGAQNDDSAWNTGSFAGGCTGIIDLMGCGNGGKVLHIRPPNQSGPFQDYNIGVLLSDDPPGSGIMPYIGMETKVAYQGSSHFFGLSIERFDPITGSTRNKYECRVEYKVSPQTWRQVGDNAGTAGQGAILKTLFSQTLPGSNGIAGTVQPQPFNWTPIKMICDPNALVQNWYYSGSIPAPNALGSFRVGSKYVQLTQAPATYQYNQAGNQIDDKYIKFEIHCGSDTNNAWSDFYFDDLIITREPSL